MAEMTFRDRLKIAALSAERSQRSAIAQTLAHVAPAPGRWHRTRVDRLLIVPQDLRTADPSFWREIEHGQFGLAGSIAFLHGRSPFDIAPPTAAWERELHGFGWLRNLAAATDDDEARRGRPSARLRVGDPFRRQQGRCGRAGGCRAQAHLLGLARDAAAGGRGRGDLRGDHNRASAARSHCSPARGATPPTATRVSSPSSR